MSNTDHYDYVIIGGGLAGISAALEINKISSTPSPSILIIEANDYLGGRITPSFKLKSNNNELLSFDMGAQYIHGHHPEDPILSFIESKNNFNKHKENLKPWMNLDPNKYQLPIFYNGDNIVEKSDLQDAISVYQEIIRNFSDLTKCSKFDLFDQIDQRINPLHKKSYSLKLITLYYLCQYEQWLGLPLNETSVNEEIVGASMFNDFVDYPSRTSSLDSTSLSNTSMYEGVILPLIDRINKTENIRYFLNSNVSFINKYDDETGRILLEDNTVIFSRKIIYTCSIGVLRKHIGVNFFKNLKISKEKSDALNTFSMGLFTKIHLLYSSRSHILSQYVELDKFYLITQGLELIYIRHDTKHRLLTITLSHTLSEWAKEAWTDFFSSLCKMLFINNVESVSDYQYCQFNEKEEFLGAYSCFNKYAKGNETDIISKPIDGLLYFAGEGTHAEYQGSMHGAYLSGQRVAREVVEN